MPRRTTEIEMTMFPFLSVLCAVIGILMLVMVAIIGTRAVGLGAAGAEREAGISSTDSKTLRAELRELTRRLNQCRRKHQQVRAAQRELLDLLAAGQDAADAQTPGLEGRSEGTELGAPEKVWLVPDPQNSSTKAPVLVEVKADGFLVYPARTFYPLADLQRPNSPLGEWLGRMDRAREGRYPVLLLRPSGVAAYEKLHLHLLQHYGEGAQVGDAGVRKSRIDFGLEPFSQDWSVVTGSP
jgi:hypothetical protein